MQGGEWQSQCHRGDGPGKKGQKAPFGYEQRLPQIQVKERSEHKGKDEGGSLVLEFPEKIPYDPEK